MLVSYYVFHVVGMEAGGLIDLVFMTNVVKLHMFAVNYKNFSKRRSSPVKTLQLQFPNN